MLELKYINLLAGQLRNYRRRSPRIYQFSCPICGDSKKNPHKARGFIYEHHGEYFFKCHNCTRSMKFATFLREVNLSLYKQYAMESFGPKSGPETVTEEVPRFHFENNVKLENLVTSCDLLPKDHQAVIYLMGRKVPTELYGQIYYCDDINVLKELFPKYKERDLPTDPRIILPVKTRQGKIIAVTCRAIIGTAKIRYVTLKDDEETSLIYGIDRVDLGKKIIVVEGPMDSLFLPNCIAACGIDFSHTFDHLVKDRDVLVYDNTPRNKECVRMMKESGDQGYQVNVWPETLKHKDINKMVQEGMTSDSIVRVIEANTFSGLNLQLRISKWGKVNDNSGKGDSRFSFGRRD